jgi:hypothetical protein
MTEQNLHQERYFEAEMCALIAAAGTSQIEVGAAANG